MKKSDTCFLTTHAGSLPRPKALTELLAKKSKGDLVDEVALRKQINAATREIVEKQVAAGVDIGNDGEMSRESFFTYVQHRMTGFGGAANRPIMRDLTTYKSFMEQLIDRAPKGENVSLLSVPTAVGDVTYADTSLIETDCEIFDGALAATSNKFIEGFMTAPSPGIIAAALRNTYYPDLESYVHAVAQALRTEYQTIINHGYLLQIDAPDLAMERHTSFADKPIREFLDFCEVVIHAINDALRDIPKDKVRLHVCWGNYEGPHEYDVPLEEIWPEIVKAQAGAVVLSMANPRHAHEYNCFKSMKLPPDCALIAGVIDTTTNYVEHPKTVADRLRRIADAVGDPKRIIAGTDCGFETSAGFGMVADEVVWRKLNALSEGAALASQDCF